MNIVTIQDNNKYLLENFINEPHPVHFRYYDSRNIEIIKNHKLTIVGVMDDITIGYGHIDCDNNINWIGICILDNYQSKGNGKKMLSYLLDYVNMNNIKNVKLSVDIDNYKALNLYLKNNFKISNITNKNYIMNYETCIELPVSLGEGLDKLTILDIKMKKIKDERKYDVENEFKLLNDKLDLYKNKYIFHYNNLLSINESIWDMQDKFRESNDSKEQTELCIKIIKENDNRFRVKKKINNLCDSKLKEQKGYNLKTAFVLTHLGLGDNITSIGAVRYLSTCYDRVIVVCKEKNKKNMELFYSDDESIEIYSVIDDKDISPRMGFDLNKFKQITKNMDLYLAGAHNFTGYNSFNDIPFNFYRDIKINEYYFWSYFHVNIPSESESLFNKISNMNYIFIHNSSSDGIAFSIDDLQKKKNINKDETLIINPCVNVYDKTHKFYNISQEFLFHPLIFYATTIINATKIIITDSSFFCMAMNLPIKTNECYLISRDNRNYQYLYKNIDLNKINRKQFFQNL